MTQDWSYRDPLPTTTVQDVPGMEDDGPRTPLSARRNTQTPEAKHTSQEEVIPSSSPQTIKPKRSGKQPDFPGLSPPRVQPLQFDIVPETPSPSKQPKDVEKTNDAGTRDQKQILVPATPSPPKERKEGKKAINAEFVINEEANGGLAYQYDAVVRHKSARKKLHAADCECCRDYYTAVGPLPPRLQAPLWATPPKKKDGGAFDPESSPTRAEQHRQAIGRHRQQWSGPRTPPDFWEIGFPDTQQVADINNRAEEMHRRKRQQVEAEASRPNGRYKRRAG